MDEQSGVDSSTTDHPDQGPLDTSVLHIGNTAGVASIIAEKQRDLGMDSTVVVFNEETYEFGADHVLQVRPESRYLPMYLIYPIELFNKVKSIQNIISSFDVIHFHYGSVISVPIFFIPYGLDLPLWKAQGKRIVMHFHGSDIRGKGVQPLYRKFTDQILVSTPDLLEWAPDSAIWVPRPIDVSKFTAHYPQLNSSDPIKIVHAPSNRDKKGTKHAQRAVSNLENRGYDVNLQLVENTPHSEALEIYKTADIIIDQIDTDHGMYGMFSIEAMALGKPVIVSLSKSTKDHLSDDLPLVSATSKNLTETISNLIDENDIWKIGRQSRMYVQEIHDIRRVVDQYNDSYGTSRTE